MDQINGIIQWTNVLQLSFLVKMPMEYSRTESGREKKLKRKELIFSLISTDISLLN